MLTAAQESMAVILGSDTGNSGTPEECLILISLSQLDCLVLQLHRVGDQLEKMNAPLMDELFNLLRDGFLLQEDLSSMGRLLLLEILEFRAGGWTLSDTAQKYYYSEVTD
ncbi:MIF4G domain-containing protein B-like [Pimephales promelas]|uniref:MIF4G domain-containing protein B-like n=1 Tax=Pimephales promelas TaxID=90988 RepID=UPI001955DCB4|nr:MIF4G domain-containing protein B-like [Pimephales promelas]